MNAVIFSQLFVKDNNIHFNTPKDVKYFMEMFGKLSDEEKDIFRDMMQLNETQMDWDFDENEPIAISI